MDDISSIDGTWGHELLPARVRVGDDVWIERAASLDQFRSQVDPGLVLGDRLRVFTWTTFNVEPTGYLEVGDDSVLVGASFMCAERIVIGRRVVLSYHVLVSDCDFHPVDPQLRRLDALACAPDGDPRKRVPLVGAPVTIGDDVHVGMGAIVLKGVSIGAGARVMPGAVVTRDVPDGATVAGNPARLVEAP